MDELQRSLLNVFTYSDLDRKVKQRKEEDRLTTLQANPSARFLVFFGNQFLVAKKPRTKPCFFHAHEIDELASDITNIVFLGSRKSKHYFAAELGSTQAADQVADDERGFTGLRECGRNLKAHNASLLSYAKAMFNWHWTHQYCGLCGSDTYSVQGGHVRRCANEKCEKNHFPRTDPAIIVSVVRDGKCLFGRQKSWPPKRFSVIAGFVEPGESIEQAVAREVLEETNIEIGQIYYHSSQPWPFPGSIMLGFSATATSEAINLNDGELQEAHWRSIDEVVSGLEQDDFRLPTPLSIAYRLVEDWFNSYSNETLANVIKRLDADRIW
ncbi:MAG: NAD(+) diphosphatase [Gammaproteobacteria bacterium]|nr:NAD(+) diphosphatase [Gammaproteobacteria bacterium]